MNDSIAISDYNDKHSTQKNHQQNLYLSNCSKRVHKKTWRGRFLGGDSSSPPFLVPTLEGGEG